MTARHLPLLLLALLACGTRTALGLGEGPPAAGGSGGTGGTGGAGGVPAPTCTALALTDVAPLAPAAARLELAAASADGQLAVALLQDGDALVTRALQPWSAWPPPFGDPFVLEVGPGGDFAVARAPYGKLAVLAHRDDAAEGSGLFFMPDVGPAAEGAEFWALVAPEARAAAVSQGYPAPPVAFNVGFLSELLLWDEPSAAGHELRHAVSTWSTAYLTGWVEHAEPALACAPAPLTGARAARTGTRWLVAVAGAPGPCSDAPPPPPTSLVIQRLAWGPEDAVDWTVDLTAEVERDDPIALTRIAAAAGGAYALVADASAGALLHLTAEGDVLAQLELEGAPALAELTALEDWLVTALVPTEQPDVLRLSARDVDGVITASLDVPLDGPATGLSLLPSPDGGALLVAWSTPSGAHVARLGCEVAS